MPIPGNRPPSMDLMMPAMDLLEGAHRSFVLSISPAMEATHSPAVELELFIRLAGLLSRVYWPWKTKTTFSFVDLNLQ